MAMPGRVRRVRLLAIALCIVTIFFLYERNAARVDQYASVLTHTVGGYGGSVLRPQQAGAPPTPVNQQDQAKKQLEKQEKQQEKQEAAAQKAPQEPIANPKPKPLGIPQQPTTSSSTAATVPTPDAKPAADAAAGGAAAPKKDEKDGLEQHELELMLKYSAGKWPENGRDALGEAYKGKPDDGRTYTLEDTPEKAANRPPASAPKKDGKPLHDGGLGRVEQEPDTPAEKEHWVRQEEHFPISSTIALPTGTLVPIPRIQISGKGSIDAARRAAVKNATRHAWGGYRKIGWGFDEVKPTSGQPRNSFNGWGATLIDSLDTLWIMNMTSEFEEAVAQVAKVDFTTSKRNDIPLFEVTIRYMGGLLAAYDISGKKYQVLLDKASELGDILYGAFDTPNRMPVTYYYWKPAFASQPHRAPSRVVMAELGSLTLEMTRLAQLTKQPKFYDAVARITNALEEWQDKTRIPGLWPTYLDASGCNSTVQMPEDGKYKDLLKKLEQGAVVLKSEPVKQGAKRSLDAVENANELEKRADGEAAGHGSLRKEAVLDSPPVKEGKAADKDGDAKLSSPAAPKAAGSAQTENTKKKAESKLTGSDICRPKGLSSCSMWGEETFTLGGASDSTFEYLPKEYLLLGGRVEQYKAMYLKSAEAAIKKLLFRPMTPFGQDILISGEVLVSWNSTTESYKETFRPKGEHLTCFTGGMFAMGGKLFNLPEHVEIGRKLTEGCIWSYNSTLSGIMPESFHAAQCADMKFCPWDEKVYFDQLDPDAAGRQNAFQQFNKGFAPPAAVVPPPVSPPPAAPAPNVDELLNKLSAEDESKEPIFGGKPVGEKPLGKLDVKDDTATKAKPAPKDGDMAGKGSTRPGVEGAALPLDLNSNVRPALPADLKGAVQSPGGDKPALPPGSGLDSRGLHKRQIIDDVDLTEKPNGGVNQPIPVPMDVNKQTTSTSTSSTSTGPFIAGVIPPTKAPAAAAADADALGAPVAAAPIAAAPVADAAAPADPAPVIPKKAAGAMNHEEYAKFRIQNERLPPGFTKILGKGYILRPEAVESVFYMYRITGEQYWRDMGWQMFQSIQRVTETPYGNTAIHDVLSRDPEKGDLMESFCKSSLPGHNSRRFT